MCQWSTLESGPLAGSEAGEKARKLGRSREPVAHSGEWTTSSARNREKGRKPGERQELVDHFREWTTSSARNREKARKLEKSQKLHSTKKRPAMPVAF